MPSEESAKLKEIVAKSHRTGRRVRFWAAPDKEVFWRAMLEHEVDLINTDDLAGLKQFLVARVK